jgi:hypothetical protein
VISSRLKGVRGLGGADGIIRILTEFETLGIVDFVDNRRAVRLQDEAPCVVMMKSFVSLCDLEGLTKLLGPIANKVVLFGSRANGKARSDSNYNLMVVSNLPEEVKKIATRHPLGKQIELLTYSADDYNALEKLNPTLVQKLARSILVWGQQ